MSRRKPISGCGTCRRLSSHNYADLRTNSAVPDEMLSLVGGDPSARPASDTVECQTCGTLYAYTYTCGFGEHDIELRRISPTEAGRAPDVEAFKRDLLSPHDDTRGYAAKCLVEHYLSADMTAEAEELTRSADEVTSSHAEAAKRYYLYHKSLR